MHLRFKDDHVLEPSEHRGSWAITFISTILSVDGISPVYYDRGRILAAKESG